MTPQETQQIKHNIKSRINKILIASTFADTINPMAKISDITTFDDADIALIKERIATTFKLHIHQDISGFTVEHLYTMINFYVLNSPELAQKFKPYDPRIDYTHLSHSESTNLATSADTSTEAPWNRRRIFSYIIANIRDAFGRPVQSTEKIDNLVKEAFSTGKDVAILTQKLKELESFFDIKIHSGMRIYNIGNAAEASFIRKGLATDSRIEYEAMDPLWATIHTVIPMNFWQNVILHELKVKISTYKLSHLKSFDEFKQLVEETKHRKSREKER